MPTLSQLSTLFAPYDSGVKVPNTGLKINGQDLSDLFAPASTGAATAPATGFLVNGADIATLYAATGTTQRLLDTWQGLYSAWAYDSGTVTTAASLAFNTNNTFGGSGRTGLFLAAGFNAADYEIRATKVSGDDLTVNSMTTFVPISEQRAIGLTATARVSSTTFKQSVVDITIRLIADNSISLTRAVTLTASAESWGPEGSLIP